MFDIFAKLLSSVASFLFPLFASYKALKTSDPAQLTPWLMYWVVLAIALLVESWTDWILVWIPFYAYIRLLFLLYLVLPQTQGARVIYQTHVHPFLEENETSIEAFIASVHDRLKSAGIQYIKRAIELLRTNVLGLPPSQQASAAPSAPSSAAPQSYTQSLLSRFSVPSARWSGNAGIAGADFYNLLASAVSAATAATTTAAGAGGAASTGPAAHARTPLVPNDIKGTSAKMSFIAAQRERLSLLLSALDREANQLKEENQDSASERPAATTTPSDGELPPSPLSRLSKSRSEADFEKLEAESGAEDNMEEPVPGSGAGVRRRTPAATSGGSWMPWGWGTGGTGSDVGKSSGAEK